MLQAILFEIINNNMPGGILNIIIKLERVERARCEISYSDQSKPTTHACQLTFIVGLACYVSGGRLVSPKVDKVVRNLFT